MSDAWRISWPKRGATHCYAQLGLPDKCGVIKDSLSAIDLEFDKESGTWLLSTVP